MIKEDNEHVIHGPAPSEPLLTMSLGKVIYESLEVNSTDKHEALIDVDTGESISYRQLLGLSCSLAESLSKTGYRKDTIISISSENNLQFFVPIISAMYIGAVIAPINNNYTKEECVHILNIFKPKVMFCSKEVCQKYVDLKNGKTPFIERVIVIDSEDEVHGAESMNGFIRKNLRHLTYHFKLAELDFEEQVAFILCSSGTTGLPKAVMLTHKNMMVRYMHVRDTRWVPKLDCLFGFLPFFHLFGLITGIFSIVKRQKILALKRFREETFFKCIQDYKISVLWVTPPLMVLLAKSPFSKQYDLSSVRELTSSAAPLSRETEDDLRKRLKNVWIRQAYGMTELSLAVAMLPLGTNKAGSCGKMASFVSCKVRDPETGRSLGPGKVGELCFKGPFVMKGYYNNDEATRNSFTSDGWLLSGDLGYYDEDECFFIVDRLKELIKYKGFQVAPAEIEGLLLSHPRIKDAAVVGLPDETAGELPLAFVVKDAKATLTERDVTDFVAGKMSYHKHMRGGVIFVSEIPKSPSGKILRRELRKMLTKYKSKL